MQKHRSFCFMNCGESKNQMQESGGLLLAAGWTAATPQFPIHQQSRGKLHHSHNQRSRHCPGWQGKPGRYMVHLPNQQKAGTSRQEHTSVTATPIEQFHDQISSSANIKQHRIFPDSQKPSPRFHYRQKFFKKIKKYA